MTKGKKGKVENSTPPKDPTKKTGPLTPHQQQYIRNKCFVKSDRQIAEDLNRSQGTIGKFRRRHGLSKRSGRPTNKQKKVAKEYKQKTEDPLEDLNIETHDMTLEQKKQLWKSRYVDSQDYNMARNILDSEELQFYINRMADYVFSFPGQDKSLKFAEADQLQQLMLLEISLFRMYRRQKDYKDAIKRWQRNFGMMDEDDPDWQPPPPQEPRLQSEMQKYHGQITKMLRSLNATREQRLAQQPQHEYSIVSIVQRMSDVKKRKEMDNEAALMEFSAAKWKQFAGQMQDGDILFGKDLEKDGESKDDEDEKEKE